MVDFFDDRGDYRLARVDLTTGAATDVGSALPADFNQQVNALFGTSFDGTGDFFEEPIVGLFSVDDQGNLIGDLRRLDLVFPSGVEPGLFVVMTDGSGDVLGIEEYLRQKSAGDRDVATLLDAVEINEIVSTSDDGNTLLLSGVDAAGDNDFFLIQIDQSGDEIHTTDVDNDGLPDAWEMEQAGGLSTSISPTQDLAGDGLTALEEFFFGLPLDGGNASPPLSPLTLDGDNLVFEFTRRTRIDLLEFDIEASATLAPGSWNPVSPVLQVIEESGETTRFRATLPLAPNTEKLFLRFSIRQQAL